MTIDKLILIFALLTSFQAIGQTKINMLILKKGQKIFLERGDYMNDKIYAITDKADTVQVILADQIFYKFKNGDFEAWAITAQLNESTDILANQASESFPFTTKTDRATNVYKEGKMGADRLVELKKNVQMTVKSKIGLFYEIEFNKNQTGYIVTTVIPGAGRTRNQTHLMRSILEQANNRGTGGTDEKYVRTNGQFVSKYTSDGYSSETFKVGNTLYIITKYSGKTEISSYKTD